MREMEGVGGSEDELTPPKTSVSAVCPRHGAPRPTATSSKPQSAPHAPLDERFRFSPLKFREERNGIRFDPESGDHLPHLDLDKHGRRGSQGGDDRSPGVRKPGHHVRREFEDAGADFVFIRVVTRELKEEGDFEDLFGGAAGADTLGATDPSSAVTELDKNGAGLRGERIVEKFQRGPGLKYPQHQVGPPGVLLGLQQQAVVKLGPGIREVGK